MAVDLHQIRLKSKVGHRLADMAGVRDDLRAAAAAIRRNYMEKDQGPGNLVVLEALQDSAAVRYGRAFSTGARNAFRIPEAWLDELPPELRGAHADFMGLRNRHVAHSVSDWEFNVPVAVLAIDRDTGAAEVRGVTVAQSRVMLVSYASARLFEQVALRLAEKVEAEMKVQEAKLLEVAKALPIDDLKSRIGQPEHWPGDGESLHRTRSRD